MNAVKIILTSTVATSCMTLFSYLLSAIMKEDFREPYFLDKIMQVEFSFQAKSLAFWEGWVIHYFVGVIFVLIYTAIWKNPSIAVCIKTGSVLGAASGIIAVVCWALVLNLYPNLTQADRTHYYVQLILAHVIFGICAAQAYKLSIDPLKPDF